MKHFSLERKHWALFRKTYASVQDKIQQEIISMGGYVFIFSIIFLLLALERKKNPVRNPKKYLCF